VGEGRGLRRDVNGRGRKFGGNFCEKKREKFRAKKKPKPNFEISAKWRGGAGRGYRVRSWSGGLPVKKFGVTGVCRKILPKYTRARARELANLEGYDDLFHVHH
jgi:hypothetical protein